MMFRLSSLSALGLLVLGGAAAAQDQPAAAEDPVVATVGDQEIHRSELEAAAADLPEQYRQMPLEMIYGPLLDRVIDARLLAMQAEESGLGDEPEVQPALERARARVLSDALVRREVSEGVTEEKVQALYEERKTDPAFARDEVHARHILVESQEEAEAIIEELEGGADFAALAEEKSTGPSGPNGGDLGYFTREQMVPEFAEAAFALEPEEITEEPVQTQFGWHVIKVLDKRTSEPSFEETAPALRQELARQVVADLLGGLREETEIQRYAMDGSPLPEGEEAAPGGAQPVPGGAQPQQ
ncbi:MAG: peptidylprolyl isomerase [Geminicoccaceae bacterium]|nr:peptidylprolyl isomerase [Geminicoccaceae bacterium]